MTIIAFDIETIPDPDIGRRIMGFHGDDFSVVRDMLSANKGKYPPPPFHRIVTIGCAALGPEGFSLTTLGTKNERGRLSGFFDLLHEGPQLVSWNGNGFDIPIIRYRALAHGIAAPQFYLDDGDWKYNNYQNRYHSRHCDLMDVLAGYGASRWASLEAVCNLLELPNKQFLTGPVYEHILKGETALVDEYCKLDCLSTMMIYLRWLHHTGGLPEASYMRHSESLIAGLSDQSDPIWHDIALQLESSSW